MGWLDILIIAVVAAAFIASVVYTVGQTKKGKCTGCGTGCSSCGCSDCEKKKKH